MYDVQYIVSALGRPGRRHIVAASRLQLVFFYFACSFVVGQDS